MESGHLRKLDHLGEAVPVLELFINIWGAGTKTAQQWYQQVRETHTHTHTHTQSQSKYHRNILEFNVKLALQHCDKITVSVR